MIVEEVMTQLEQESHSKTSEALLLLSVTQTRACVVLCLYTLLSLTLSFHSSALFLLLSFDYSFLTYFCQPITFLLSLFSVQSTTLNGVDAALPTAQSVQLQCYNSVASHFLTLFLCPLRWPFDYSEVLK